MIIGDMATKDRFGTGLARPFRRAKTGFITISGPEKVLQSVEQVVGTPVGKLPWRASFGCRVPRLRHMNNRGLQNLARVDVADALQRWEPRFRLHTVRAASVGKDARNVIDLEIRGEIGGAVQEPIKTSL